MAGGAVRNLAILGPGAYFLGDLAGRALKPWISIEQIPNVVTSTSTALVKRPTGHVVQYKPAGSLTVHSSGTSNVAKPSTGSALAIGPPGMSTRRGYKLNPYRNGYRRKGYYRKGYRARKFGYARMRNLPIEMKYYDTSVNDAVTTTLGSWTNSNVNCVYEVDEAGVASSYTSTTLIPTRQGSGYGSVNGNTYKLFKMRCRGQISPSVLSDQDDINQSQVTRVALVLDKCPNGTQVTGPYVFQDSGANPTNSFDFQNVYSSKGRFKILGDQTNVHHIEAAMTDATNKSSQQPGLVMFDFKYVFKKPYKVNIKPGASASSVNQTINCNIFLLLQTSNKAVTISCANRAYYKDI